jgi:hypothetical protein
MSSEELNKTYAMMLKVLFFIALGYGIYNYVPSEFWDWWKNQAEWAMKLVSNMGK